MRNSLHSLKVALAEHGFNIGGRYNNEETGVNWCATKEVLELSTEYGIVRFLVIVPKKTDGCDSSVDVRLVGEDSQESAWMHLGMSDMSPDDIIPRLDRIEKALIAAWRAVGEVMEE